MFSYREQLRLLKKLLSEEKCYYSIILDKTTDVSIKKCLAVVIRFVYKNKVRDKFLGLIEFNLLLLKHYLMQ